MSTTGHHCFVAAAADDTISADWCSVTFEDALRDLHHPVTGDDVTAERFLLHRDPALEVYFAPLDRFNASARVALVGITPGRSQARLALATASAALRAGADLDVALGLAKSTASFAGPMRRNLVAMLDGIGLAAALGIPTCDDLFHDRIDLVAMTSVVCHPVFVRGGENYRGSSPALGRHPLLRAFAERVLAAALASAPDALVVPLGVAAEQGVRLAGVDPGRVLSGFPHPSGGNGHRVAFYARERSRLTEAVTAWGAR
ncbi:hypothetical protein GCM10023201_33910 [Actinomycetospora corticicola]|uniref:Uracil DNA glycosylase superfamily protein n=1 Tax=Actinomycetospora corticicola TaxID=663602 RepID=A0A7Y9DS22_9PSEU|nr:hypothetical protein [Actinomycetospora corticicola]NYD34486.1 hypothetical protein [Actinomycetospora corticicola]